MTAAFTAPDDLELEEHASGHRISAPVPRRTIPPTRTGWHVHPLLLMGLSLVATIALLVGISQIVRWGSDEPYPLQYGDPRTFQIDAVVGNGDNAQHPSHFVAINLHGTVTIIEFPAGDPGSPQVLASYGERFTCRPGRGPPERYRREPQGQTRFICS